MALHSLPNPCRSQHNIPACTSLTCVIDASDGENRVATLPFRLPLYTFCGKYLVVCFHVYLQFNIAIAAVSPMEEHDSAACFGTVQAYVNHVTTPLASSTSFTTLLSLWLMGQAFRQAIISKWGPEIQNTIILIDCRFIQLGLVDLRLWHYSYSLLLVADDWCAIKQWLRCCEPRMEMRQMLTGNAYVSLNVFSKLVLESRHASISSDVICSLIKRRLSHTWTCTAGRLGLTSR